MKKIRWGIAGPGKIAKKFAKAVLNLDCCELTAVASRSAERGEEFAKQFGITTVFSSYEQMAESDVVDAVYVATPHPFHKTCSEIFINAKKHVLCEKPLCVNEKDAVLLTTLANEKGVFLMEAMWTKFLPAVMDAVKLVNDGEIGQIRALSADFCYNCPKEAEPKIYDNGMAGGSLLDVGVYGLNFASLFLGYEPESITACANIEDGVDCHTQVLMKYKNGAVADISSALNVYKPESAYVYGSKGHIFVPDFYKATEFFVRLDDGNEKHIVNKCIGDGFEEEIIEVCKCINEGKLESSVVPHCDTVKIMGQMDKIRSIIGIEYPFDKD